LRKKLRISKGLSVAVIQRRGGKVEDIKGVICSRNSKRMRRIMVFNVTLNNISVIS
jgi:hypothetical protein